MGHTLYNFFAHNAPTLALAVLWFVTYFLRGSGRPKRGKQSHKPVTLSITIAAERVRVAIPFLDKSDDVAARICMRGPKLEVVALGDHARSAATPRADEPVVGILASDLWQQLRVWPPLRKRVAPDVTAEIVVFDPFALDTFSLTAVDAFLRYEVAVVSQGISVLNGMRLRRGVISLQLETFEQLTNEQQLALVKIVSQFGPRVMVNDRHFFKV